MPSDTSTQNVQRPSRAYNNALSSQMKAYQAVYNALSPILTFRNGQPNIMLVNILRMYFRSQQTDHLSLEALDRAVRRLDVIYSYIEQSSVQLPEINIVWLQSAHSEAHAFISYQLEPFNREQGLCRMLHAHYF